MAEYINKAELIDYIDEGKYRSKYELCFCENDVVNMINRLPTIDIVTCEECKWWKPYPYKSCEGGHGITDADWFCADGERKEDD